MVLFNKHFWKTALTITLTFFIECIFAAFCLVIYLVIYTITEYEPLNTGVLVLLIKGFLILLPSIYNFRKIIEAYKNKDFVTVLGFLVITVVYSICIVYLGGGGR